MEGLGIRVGHPAHTAENVDRSRLADGYLGRHIAELHRVHDLWLVVEIPTEGARADAGCPEELRGPQRVRGDDDRRRVDFVDLSGVEIASGDADDAAVYRAHRRDECARDEPVVGVAPRLDAEDDVRTRPPQASVVLA